MSAAPADAGAVIVVGIDWFEQHLDVETQDDGAVLVAVRVAEELEASARCMRSWRLTQLISPRW